MSRLALTIRIFVGLLFLTTGALKLNDPVAFAEAVYNYQLVPARLLTLSALSISWLEVISGLALTTGFLSRSAATITALLSLAFALAISSAMIRGLDIDCGCFSTHSPVNSFHVGLNLIVMAASLWLCTQPVGSTGQPQAAAKKSLLRRKTRLILVLLACVSMAFNLVVGWSAARRVASHRLDSLINSFNPFAARFAANSTTYDFGKIPPSPPVKAEFEFKNVGKTTMHISEVTASCGCTEVTTSTSTLAPGQSGGLTLKFSPDATPGPFEKTIRLFSNAAGSPHVLRIRGSVQAAYRVEPPSLNLGLFDQQAELLYTQENMKLELTNVIKAPNGLEVRLTPEGDRTRIIVSREDSPQTPTGGAIWIGTNDPYITRVVIPVLGPLK